MDMKLSEIQPMVPVSWVKYDGDLGDLQDNQAIQPVAGGESASKSKLESGEKSLQAERNSSLGLEKAKQITEDIQSYLSDLNIQFDFSVSNKTGNLVIKVLDRETGDIIRQIPPEELLTFREKLKELRGVLLDGTA